MTGAPRLGAPHRRAAPAARPFDQFAEGGAGEMPKGYIIGHISVTDPDAYAEYVRRDTPILESYGGRFIVRGGASEAPEGPVKDRHVVIEFPSFEAARAAFHSPEYQEVAEIRRRTSESDIILVEGAE